MSTKKRKDTFVFYSEWVDITDESGIDDTSFRNVIRALVQYNKDGTLPANEDFGPEARMFFFMGKQKIDKNTERYNETVEKRRVAGKAGARARTMNRLEQMDQPINTESKNDPTSDNMEKPAPTEFSKTNPTDPEDQSVSDQFKQNKQMLAKQANASKLSSIDRIGLDRIGLDNKDSKESYIPPKTPNGVIPPFRGGVSANQPNTFTDTPNAPFQDTTDTSNTDTPQVCETPDAETQELSAQDLSGSPPQAQTTQLQPVAQKPKRSRKAADELTPEQQAGFDRFWEVFPRKDKKKASRAIWRRLNPDETMTDRMVKSVQDWWENEWKNRDAKYIPLPTTWLNDERWECRPWESMPKNVMSGMQTGIQGPRRFPNDNRTDWDAIMREHGLEPRSAGGM